MLTLLGKTFFPSLGWTIPTDEPVLHLTFDDGPVPQATPFVLDTLKKFNAQATFFCVGENVKKYPEIFKRVLEEGHAVGNHTYHHLNGWKTKNKEYIRDIADAQSLINSKFFRPPYGKLKPGQLSIINKQYSVIMWDVLSKDYDKRMTGEQCLQRVLRKSKAGSIVVFHDSMKAWDRLQYVLPAVLEFFSNKGFSFKRIPL